MRPKVARLTCIRYLPSFPYQDNPLLHLYAGLVALYLARPSEDLHSLGTYNLSLLREARSHLERAQSLDPQNEVATSFLSKAGGTTLSPHLIESK